LESKLANGDEVVIYKADFNDPQKSLFCDDEKTITEDYDGTVHLCKNGVLNISFHKSPKHKSNANFNGIDYEPLYSNLVLDVDAKLLDGKYNVLGFSIFANYANAPSATYYIYMDNGDFDIVKCTDNNVCKSVTGLYGEKLNPHPAIKQLKEGNHFTLKLIDGNILFYVNNTLVSKLDEKITTGRLGLAYTDDDTTAYDNLTLKIPSKNEIDQEKQLFSKKLSLERPDSYIKEAQDIFGTMVFGKDGLEFKIRQNVTYRHNLGPVLENSFIQVDFKPDVPLTYGLYCRRSDYARYEAVYSVPDGTYTIYKYVNDTVFTKLANGKVDINIKKDGDKVVYITMRLDCIGNEIALYLENQLLAKVRNGEYRWGFMGLTAGNDSKEAPVTGAFKNLDLEEK
jgi:hypothetical protein